MISRIVLNQIKECFFTGKAIILLGARQTGKTTLIKKLLTSTKKQVLYMDGDDPLTQISMNRPNTMQLREIIGIHDIIFIDEAQKIFDIGITSKIIVDQFPHVQLILSGSSAFELTQSVYEPLTGRKWTFDLWPISWKEWTDHIGYLKSEQDLENRLVYGMYPDVLNNPGKSATVLKELSDSYLYKDVLMFGNIKKPEEIQKLLQALSYQVGSEVSFRELSEIVGMDPKTIDKYITILERAFVIFRLHSFSRNMRNEIKHSRKIYFYDNGIRNIVIGQLSPVSLRQDIGALWENFLISERLKNISYSKSLALQYFWRTTQQQEIDYIEEFEGKIYAYEFKWNQHKKVKFPASFIEKYNPECKIINRENYREFLNQI